MYQNDMFEDKCHGIITQRKKVYECGRCHKVFYWWKVFIRWEEIDAFLFLLPANILNMGFPLE